ncbi:myristoyl-CoA:protein N-myristoyltransferase, N-terminal domain containing protein, putative [Babesia bigemina]|uniref:Glycylpeptide N-tetradecanoyltransferase n=1 Tax=Babesia bigemina TaxID=5866 RepID=A0A061D493_BABBI|nr:myristoyl-CoA:protein N-myristoyltransferase, N-terminal domain containing protein, putative [Babesia bigemina]CDR93784.1 myristoyl-CoA:protein N-myristoyltransferase, N-terminal domain containing protein, putative [Babesia bigemina]|eukprot:XP_012765970.1 myristoyl-CoA:protein N-myristoyltransferase, N-terminal domain containing protein, putative [Babesia bigemina]
MEENGKHDSSSESTSKNLDALAGSLESMHLEGEQTVEEEPKSSTKLLDILMRAFGRKTHQDKHHAFWNTQPVCKYSEEVDSDQIGAVDFNTKTENVRDAFGFGMTTQLYYLLYENYVEDDGGMLRFDYKTEFLQWALASPGYKKDWHVAVRVKSSKRLVGFISGIPVTINVLGTSMEVAEINFLCVHKQLRSKRLAPVLIREITRRVNRCGIWQAVYTAAAMIPKPITTCRYWHRTLNIRRLVDARFTSIGHRMTISRAQRLFKLPPETDGIVMRPMEPRDVDDVLELLQNYLPAYKIHPVYTREEVEHWFVPRGEVIYTYVKENSDGKVTDMLSFYRLNSSVLNNPKIDTIKAAYSYYNVATTISFKKLMEMALNFANEHEFDVFNALDLMENDAIFEELKFGPGEGSLHYYLYNWRIPSLKPSDIGLVLL